MGSHKIYTNVKNLFKVLNYTARHVISDLCEDVKCN